MKTRLLSITILFFTLQTAVAQNFKYGKVSEAELLQKQHPTDATANAAILFREVKTNFEYTSDSGFYMVTDVFERVKIYTKEGFDWATREVDLYQGSGGKDDEISGLKGVTYSLGADGKIQEAKLKSEGIFDVETSKYLNQTKFTMPNLSEGCVIEYRYSIKSPFISNIDEFKFQERIPVNRVEVRFVSPEYFVFQTHQKGWLPYKIGKDRRDRNLSFSQTTQDIGDIGGSLPKTETRNITFKEDIYEINMDNVPAMKEEAYAGNIENYATSLKFELSYTDFPGSTMQTYSTTWEAATRTIYNTDSFGAELERSNYFEKDIDALLKGVSNPDEKIARVFEFVKSKMNWNSFNGYFTNEGVKEAYKKGTGNVADINLMFVAMLRHAGVSANPVLISTKTNGIPLFPTINGFNYVVAGVEMGSNVILLDATHKDSEMGILQPKILNWQGRIIRKDLSSDWVSLSPTSPAIRDAMVTINLAEDLSLSGETKNRFTGHYALMYRDDYKNLGELDIQKELEKDLGQTELSNVKFENLKVSNQPVSLHYNFETIDGLENVGGKLYFSPMAFLALKENPFKLEKRDYPIDYGYPIKDRYLVTINLPEGYKLESTPENAIFSLGENMGGFKYMISQVGNKLQLSVELSINDSFISAEDYGNLKKFYEMIIAKEAEKVVLIKA